MLRKAGFPLVVAILLAVLVSPRPAGAGPSAALDAQLSTGVDPDLTAIGRLHAGGMLVFDNINLGLEAHIAFSRFLQMDTPRGVESQSISPLNIGIRYGIKSPRFIGPYAALGAGYGFLFGEPRERGVDDADTCATASQEEKTCSYRINRHVDARLGLGWGFSPGKKTTVGVRLDITYFAFSLMNGEDQPLGSPNPNSVPRPQDTWAVMLGLEFMRWP